MGMFDTFILNKKIKCSKCSKKYDFVQNKSFQSTLEKFEVGDIVDRNFHGVFSETIFCDDCKIETETFLIVNKGIYLGNKKRKNKALKKLNSFGLLDLYDLYFTKSIEAKRLAEKNFSTSNYISKYINFLNSSEDEKNDFLQSFWFSDFHGKNNEEILNFIITKLK
jgi:hypothetical protein